MAQAQYQSKNLVSNQVKQAAHTDPLLVNGWGLVHGPGTPWWISDNNSGWATLYDGSGKQVTKPKVLIPTAGNGPGSPTGLNGPGSPTGTVFNGSNDFQLQGSTPFFLFATLDGTISGWVPQSNFNEAIVAWTIRRTSLSTQDWRSPAGPRETCFTPRMKRTAKWTSMTRILPS